MPWPAALMAVQPLPHSSAWPPRAALRARLTGHAAGQARRRCWAPGRPASKSGWQVGQLRSCIHPSEHFAAPKTPIKIYQFTSPQGMTRVTDDPRACPKRTALGAEGHSPSACLHLAPESKLLKGFHAYERHNWGSVGNPLIGAVHWRISIDIWLNGRPAVFVGPKPVGVLWPSCQGCFRGSAHPAAPAHSWAPRACSAECWAALT